MELVKKLQPLPSKKKPSSKSSMHMEVIEGRNDVDILSRVLGQCLVRQHKAGTSLMICPDLFPDKFEKYLEVYNMLVEGVLEGHELTDDVQIAPFHPLFQFEGSGPGDVDNYTNRSPFPIFHILREEEVGRAVNLLNGDASTVWNRNVQLMQDLEEALDRSALEAFIAGKPAACTATATEDKVRQVLQQLRKKHG